MFNKMEYVYEVYREQSFTKAAEKLFISQPCLSAAIKKIEEEIGMPLFERRYSAVRPTEIGRAYIETAEKMMSLERDFTAKLNDINAMESGSITIGGPNYASSYIIPPIVSRFLQLYPKINVSLVETGSVELVKKINEEEVDLVIDSDNEEKEFYEYFPLFNEKVLLAVAADHPCNQGLEDHRILPENIFQTDFDLESVPPVPITHFKNERFILLKSGNNMYRHAMDIFKKSNFTPNVNFRLDQLITSYALAASGNGVCFVTDTIFKYHKFKDHIYLYNIEGSGTRTLYVAQKRNRYTTNAMKKFISLAQETFLKEI